MSTEKKKSLGVVIARFQVPDLHKGHQYLLDEAYRRHDRVLVLLGVSEGLPNDKNPLSFNQRESLVAGYLVGKTLYTILPITDHKSDEVWSNRVDALIDQTLAYNQFDEAYIYGSRDSFISYYHGKYDCREIIPVPAPTGTKERAECREHYSSGARSTLIAYHNSRFPIVYPVVDVCVVDKYRQTALVGKKPFEDAYRFIGGFVDSTDVSYEHTAFRELSEEAGSKIIPYTEDVRILGSWKVPDFRYQGTKDSVMTTLFRMSLSKNGNPDLAQAGDDLTEVAWVPFVDLVDSVMPNHKRLASSVIASLKWDNEMTKSDNQYLFKDGDYRNNI